jgi:hypothetical protein
MQLLTPQTSPTQVHGGVDGPVVPPVEAPPLVMPPELIPPLVPELPAPAVDVAVLVVPPVPPTDPLPVAPEVCAPDPEDVPISGVAPLLPQAIKARESPRATTTRCCRSMVKGIRLELTDVNVAGGVSSH